MRSITEPARDLLKHLEGEHGGKPSLVGYLDDAGKPTDGFGHTGPEVREGRAITADQAEANLDSDLAAPCSAVAAHVTVALNDNQFAALVIWVFNVGITAFLGSTLLRLLNDGKYESVPDQLKLWDKVTDPETKKKKTSAGLQARRAAEVALWLTPDPDQVTTAGSVMAPQEQPETRSAPTPPPQPKSVLGTSTGKAQAGAIAATATSAVVEGLKQVQPAIDAVKDASSSIGSLPHLLMITGWVCAAVAIGFCAWTLWDRHTKLKSEGR